MLTKYKKLKLPDGSTIDEHRLVWEQYYGLIPEGMLVHHKNGNGRDNRIENLELLTSLQHHGKHPEMEIARIAGVRKVLTKVGPDGTSWCTVCKQFRPVEDFGSGPRYNGLRYECNSCRKSKGWDHGNR